MEFCKDNIHTYVLKASKYSQLTVDDDFNIPDYKEDIDKVIASNGRIILGEVSAEEGKVKVSGTVCFKTIYKTVGETAGIEVYEGEIPFEDFVNVDGVSRGNSAECKCKLEDITISMINSRKLEVRGLIGNGISVYEDSDADCAVDLVGGQGIECLYKDVLFTDLVISKNDMFKVREELAIQDNKPNIKEILWSSVELRNPFVKVLDEKISVRGELEIFVIYKGTEEHSSLQYMFSVRSIVKELDCQGAKEGMIMETSLELGKGEVCSRQDADGEDRIIAVDYNVNMNIKMYEDKSYHLLNDLYSPTVNIKAVSEELKYENLLMRNQAKAKVSHRQKIGTEREKLLSIFHVFGSVDVDDINLAKDSMRVNGVVKVTVLYVAAGDDPLSSVLLDIPFDYDVDTATLPENASVRVTPSLDMLSANLLNSEEIEIKAQVNLGISVFVSEAASVIVDMEVSDIDYEKKAAMPGIVGYIVKEGDTIWSIARKYYATTESIRNINNLDSDNIKTGDRLLIIKS